MALEEMKCTRNMPRREDDYIRKMAAAMDRLSLDAVLMG